MAFINTVVGRAAAAIWGQKLGNATMNAVLAQINTTPGGFIAVLNSSFNASYAAFSNVTLADAFVNSLGLTGAARTQGLATTLNALNATNANLRGQQLYEIAAAFSSGVDDPLYGSFARAFNANVAAAVQYSSTPGTVDAVLGFLPTASAFVLTTAQDNITGTTGNDTFNAFIFDNSNTLQSGDYVDGGTGADRLFADMGTSQGFAVTPVTRSVETIAIRAQSSSNDSGANNVAGTNRVQIDAERIEGETRYESNNSRADLIIEDVRIGDSQITRDITIAMVQTDPGNVDFGVYFDQPSLRANTQSSASLTLEIIDTKAATEGADPLRDSPFDGFRFQFNGTFIQFTSQAFNDAQTYAQLLTATQALLASDVRTNGVVTASLGGPFSVAAVGGNNVSGTQIVLSATNATFGVGTWIALAGVPATSATSVNQFTGIASSNELVTSTIVLDDVGRGATGGSLVVGGLATGLTDSARGVDRFDITVERTSRVQNIDSTNNWLKEVVVKNGATAGNLVVLGNAFVTDAALPGAPKDVWGFNDVRLVDGSAMTGTFTFDALVSAASFAKYMILTDTDGNPAGDNTSVTGRTTQRADFIYSGGSGSDSMNIVVDGTIAASNSTIQAGREDFTFRVNGNAGNDAITFRMVDITNDGLIGGLGENWYQHQKALRNVTIDGGAGNDTVRTPGAGDVIILLGDGNDVAYVDNSGGQAGLFASTGAITNTNGSALAGERAMFVFNTFNSDSLPANGGAAEVAARNRNDLLSDANSNSIGANNGSLFRATVEVTYMGLTSKAQLPLDVFRPTDLHVNQAIKSAINNNVTLNKLLVAEDGPGFSLVVRSLIDGVQVVADLGVVVTAATASDLTPAQLNAVYNSIEPTDTTPTAAELQLLLGNGVANFNARGDYVTALATDGAINITGNNSTTPSDNRITPGAGDDVIVLGTTSAAAALESSNDRVVYNAVFGNDVIVNFQVGAAATGGDTIDFTGLGFTSATGTVVGAFGAAAPLLGTEATADNALFVRIEDALNDTAAEIAGLFVNDAANVTAKTWVYVAVNAANVGTVYQLTDAATTGGVTATLMGTIDLADTTWATLTTANLN